MSQETSSQPTIEQQHAAEIDKLRTEVADLRRKADEKERADALAAAKNQAAVQNVPSTAQVTMDRQRAIESVGGFAKWKMLPLAQRLAILGLPPATEADIELSRSLFGSGASALAAASLQRINPARYTFLKHLHREL